MFDRTNSVYITESSRSANVNVVEKRAPTDDSVKLLKEMELAAENKLLDVFRIGCKDNKLDCIVVKYYLSDYDLDHNYLVMFSLNNVKFKESFTIKDSIDNTKAIIFSKVTEIIASKVTQFIIKNMLTNKETNNVYD